MPDPRLIAIREIKTRVDAAFILIHGATEFTDEAGYRKDKAIRETFSLLVEARETIDAAQCLLIEIVEKQERINTRKQV